MPTKATYYPVNSASTITKTVYRGNEQPVLQRLDTLSLSAIIDRARQSSPQHRQRRVLGAHQNFLRFVAFHPKLVRMLGAVAVQRKKGSVARRPAVI